MTVWDVVIRALRAIIVKLSATLRAVRRGVNAIAKLGAVWILVADMTLLVTASAPAGQVVEVCIKLVVW